MQLNAQQAQQLRMTLPLRDKLPTIGSYMRLFWRVYLFMFALAAVLTSFYWWFGWPLASALIAGVVIGALLRDIRWLRQFVGGWPLSNAITDWARVEQLLAEYDARNKK